MKTLVVAPHPDDEILGTGGTLLRRVSQGGTVGWLVITSMAHTAYASDDKLESRQREIENVRQALSIEARHAWCLNFPTTRLDTIPLGDLVSAISHVVQEFQPEEVFVPFWGDAHSDHRVVFDAVAACTKWFRHPNIKRVLAYETLSETDAAIGQRHLFNPNVFVDISEWIEEKIRILRFYESELGEFPFPRSEDGIRALSHVRGVASGFVAAEGFMLLLERE